MDEFGLDAQELTGNLISMTFGPGGRINQIWITDPGVPDGAEFQVVCGPIAFGEEVIDDYFPGTILLGARTDPEEPWILSRNSTANLISDPDEPGQVEFEYEFGLIHELKVTGKFTEITGLLPQIAWDITIKNRSRQSVEIGELGFPFALATVLDGYERSDQGLKEMFDERLYVHKFIGGAASYVSLQRMHGNAPGMVIFPGEETSWEFYHQATASINTPFRWEGIPVVYVHSRATIEREGWPEWFNGHTSIVMEPGEEKNLQIRFAPLDRDHPENVAVAMTACGRPAIKVLPSAVAPRDVGIAVEVSGSTPTKFWTDVESEIESDSDDDGGFCFVRPTEPGAVRLSFEDTLGRESYCHLLFTEPIADLIESRATWIEENQCLDANGIMPYAILPADNRTGEPVVDLEIFQTPFGIESSLSEALFLAEKNLIHPNETQIKILEDYVDQFLRVRFQNPSNHAFSYVLMEPIGVASNSGRGQVYALAVALYHTLGRISNAYGTTRATASWYSLAVKTAEAMFRFAHPATVAGVGLPFVSDWPLLLSECQALGLIPEAERIQQMLTARVESMGRRRYPFFKGESFSMASFDEASFSAGVRGDYEASLRIAQYATIARSQSPSWWWYGAERRQFDDAEMGGHPIASDKGELGLASSGPGNAQIFFRSLDRDYFMLPEMQLRSAFGAMLGVWALVRADGAAAMGFCPDEASKHFGIAWSTGDVGIGLTSYLRNVASYVLPVPAVGVTTFGCHFEVTQVENREILSVKPWDGVGKRVVIRHLGFEALATRAQIQQVDIDTLKKRASLVVSNPADKTMTAEIRIQGLWGEAFSVSTGEHVIELGELVITLELAPKETKTVQIEAI